MAATIKIKNSSTASAVPTSSDLVQGELAVNVTDKRIFTENASGTVVELGTNPTSIALPAGSASAPTLLASGDTNTGIFFPAADTVGISTGGTERARVDSSGNLGLGVTPSAWSGFTAFQVGNAALWTTSTNNTHISSNLYYNGSARIYIGSNYATEYAQQNGEHKWFNAASGTAGGTVSVTQAMTLDASGNLGVGTTSPNGYRINVQQAAADNLGINVTASNGTSLIRMLHNGTVGAINVSYTGGGSYSPLAFFTSDQERARIDSSGNLLVGTTSNANVARIKLAWTTGGYGIESVASANTLSYHIVFQNASNTPGAISTTNNATTYATTSDYRLKENIAPMTGALATVAQLKPCTYTWKTDGSSGQGFIAHELQEVVPDAVVGEKDAVKEDGAPQYQNIDTSFLVATLTAAIQELKAEFDAYKASHP